MRRELAGDERGSDGGASLDLGIGGSRTPEQLKCLHAHAAFALARPGYELGDAIVRELREPWPTERCCSEPLARTTSSLSARAADVESARLEWEHAYRDLAELARDPALEERSRSQLGRVTTELRRRVGGTFTLRELAEPTGPPTPGRARCSSEQGSSGLAADAHARRGGRVPSLRPRCRGLPAVSVPSRPAAAAAHRRRRQRPVRRTALVVIGAVLAFLLGIAFARDGRRAAEVERRRHERTDADAAAAGRAPAATVTVTVTDVAVARRYSSSDASSSPATMSPTAQARLIQMPSPLLAKKKLSGIEMIRTSTSTVAIEPSPIATRLSGTDAGI